eukprot:2000216-Amphidinium_carterae.1
MPTQMGTRYNVGAVININEQTQQSYKAFCPYVPMTAVTEEARRQYVTVTGEGLNMSEKSSCQ